jgi:HPt (histidine-containing phosphotransfer) domain-containing protein
VVNLDIATPMDYKEQIKNLGDAKIYFKILERFEGMSLIQETKELVQWVNDKNYHEIKESVHKLKSTAGYVGASHIHYACYYMQDHYLKGEVE